MVIVDFNDLHQILYVLNEKKYRKIDVHDKDE